ncbi:MAG TPA: hypothetical protein VI699_03415 [Candidatus Acidoferrales bacterium]|nr:hypothetical protein [Candidatus Acidoferrales bacterium]
MNNKVDDSGYKTRPVVDERAELSKILCGAAYMFERHSIPYTTVLDRKFLTMMREKYAFREMPELGKELEEFEKLSATLKTLAMPQEVVFRDGRTVSGGIVTTITQVSIAARKSDQMVAVKLYGKTAEAEKTLKDIVLVLASLAGFPSSWEHYEKKLEEKHFETTTEGYLGRNLLELLSPELQAFIKGELTSRGKDVVLKGAAPIAAERLHVVVHPHSIQMRVHVQDLEAGSRVVWDFGLDHVSLRDFPDRVVEISSEFDFDTHMLLVRTLREHLKPVK